MDETKEVQQELQPQTEEEPVPTTRRCCTCKIELPIESFCHTYSQPNGYHRRCKSCQKQVRGLQKYKSKAEREDCVKSALGLLRRGFSDYEIKKHLAETKGININLAHRTLIMTRETLRRKYAPLNRKGKPDQRLLVVDALAVYDGIIRNPNATNSDIIAAQTRKDKLLGLETLKIEATVDTTIHADVTVRNITEIAKTDDHVRDLMIQLSRALPGGPELQ